MEPALVAGDVVVYRRGGVLAGEGDIVLFDKAGWAGGVLHRVVSLEANGSLLTRGDANLVPDSEPVQRDAVRGVVVSVLPFGRAFQRVRTGVCGVLNSSINRMMRSDDGEANGTYVPTGTEPHRLEGLRERAGRFTLSAAT
jgi:hypothetical protein